MEKFIYIYIKVSESLICKPTTRGVNDWRAEMNGTPTVTATEEHQHPHQQTPNETSSEHPRSPTSPLSVRHGESKIQNLF